MVNIYSLAQLKSAVTKIQGRIIQLIAQLGFQQNLTVRLYSLGYQKEVHMPEKIWWKQTNAAKEIIVPIFIEILR